MFPFITEGIQSGSVFDFTSGIFKRAKSGKRLVRWKKGRRRYRPAESWLLWCSEEVSKIPQSNYTVNRKDPYYHMDSYVRLCDSDQKN